MKISILDPVWTQLDEEAADFLRNELSYEVIRWEKHFGRTKRIMEKGYLIQGWEYEQYMMLSGFVPRAIEYFNRWNEPYEYVSDIREIEYSEPFINGEKFRPYQRKLIDKALEHGYGTIVAPTGSGKSFIIFGVLSSFPDSNILLLVHTVDLVQQLIQGLQEIGYDPGQFTGSKKEMKRITVATVQSYNKVADEYTKKWDVVMVDEGHHVSSPESGMYFNALAYCGAPIRFAFTATIADKAAQRVGLEGLIGPVIGELTMAEGQNLGFLAKPKITFTPCELPNNLFYYKSDPGYTTIYREGIVDNFNRNSRIILAAEKEVKNGGIVLILVKHIRHMDNILEYMDIYVDIVKGSVDKDTRLAIKNDLKSGKAKCVIATTSWTEGIDIPNLTMVINAGGGKSEKETLQKIGRGLRKTKNKNMVKIIDFFDVRDPNGNPLGKQKKGYGPKHTLHKQSIDRWEVYTEQGWKPKII